MSSLYRDADKPYYDVALICPNGHVANGSSVESPHYNSEYCSECGEKTINACPACNEPIRGYLHNTGVVTMWPFEPSGFCHACGKPFPWTERKIAALAEAIDEAEQLSSDEKTKLKESIADIVVATPKTDTAVARLKAGISKAGKVGGKLIYDVAIKVAADVVSKALEGGPGARR